MLLAICSRGPLWTSSHQRLYLSLAVDFAFRCGRCSVSDDLSIFPLPNSLILPTDNSLWADDHRRHHHCLGYAMASGCIDSRLSPTAFLLRELIPSHSDYTCQRLLMNESRRIYWCYQQLASLPGNIAMPLLATDNFFGGVGSPRSMSTCTRGHHSKDSSADKLQL